MKQLYLLFISSFICCTLISQTQKSSFVPTTKDEKELLRLTKLMSSASETGDSAAYQQYMDDNFLITYSLCNENSYGKFLNKQSAIAKWAKPDSSNQSHSTPTVYNMQVSSKTAIVHSYILDEFLDEEGKKIKSATWATDIWIKRKKKWYWFSSHESVLF